MEITKENIFKEDIIIEKKIIPVGKYLHKMRKIKIEVLRVSGKYIEVRTQGFVSVKNVDFLKDYEYIPENGMIFH